MYFAKLRHQHCNQHCNNGYLFMHTSADISITNGNRKAMELQNIDLEFWKKHSKKLFCKGLTNKFNTACPTLLVFTQKLPIVTECYATPPWPHSELNEIANVPIYPMGCSGQLFSSFQVNPADMIFWILFAFVYIFVTVLSIGSWLHTWL